MGDLSGGKGCFLVIVVAVVLIVLIASYFPQTTYVATIIGLERINGSGSGYYVVFTTLENGEIKVFANMDSLWFGKMNSSDVQAALRIGTKYTFKVHGTRLPLFSWYENILKYEVVK